MLDIDADLKLKTEAAPRLVSLLRRLTTSDNWLAVQARAQRLADCGLEYCTRHGDASSAIDGDELLAYLQARVAKKCRVALLIDFIANQHDNGGRAIEAIALLSLSITRHAHGQSQRSIAHDSSFGISTSHNTTYKLLNHLADVYIEAFPSLLRRLLDESVERRDPDEPNEGKVTAALIMKVDNYVKGGKQPRRHLRHQGNLPLLQTESGLVDCPLPQGNCLLHADDRAVPLCGPIDCDLLDLFVDEEMSKFAMFDPYDRAGSDFRWTRRPL